VQFASRVQRPRWTTSKTPVWARHDKGMIDNRSTDGAALTPAAALVRKSAVQHAWSVGPRAPAYITSVPVWVPGAIVPVALVAGFTVVPVVVVAATPVPVAAPPWIPPLAGAAVIIRERRGLGLGQQRVGNRTVRRTTLTRCGYSPESVAKMWPRGAGDSSQQTKK
jgi:hypothetical protein